MNLIRVERERERGERERERERERGGRETEMNLCCRHAFMEMIMTLLVHSVLSKGIESKFTPHEKTENYRMWAFLPMEYKPCITDGKSEWTAMESIFKTILIRSHSIRDFCSFYKSFSRSLCLCFSFLFRLKKRLNRVLYLGNPC